MFTPRIIQGRRIGAEELAFIRGLIAGHPQWSRRQLSIGFCERVQWRSPEAPLVLAQPDLFEGLAPEPITEALATLRPLEVILSEPCSSEAEDFVRHLARHHYLGWGDSAGANLRYLIRDRHGRDLACVLFAGAAWQLKARDAFIGWNKIQRERRLGLLVNNTRFLILPHVRVPHLASHILGLILRRLRADWQRKYAMAPVLAESFVERERFARVCYRAANWILAGHSCGRSRADRDHTLCVPIKEVFLYPLAANFRKQLCA